MIQQVPLTQQKSCATYLKTCVTYASGSANLLHAELLSFVEHQQHQCLEKRDLQLLLTLQDTIVILKAVHSRSLSISSMLCLDVLTSLNSAFSTAWPSVGCHCSFLPLCLPR